ncbi:MAG: tetratricopeptide repeat protein [Anaerolineales bacterium]
MTLGSLGWVEFHTGNEPKAEEYLQQALALQEKAQHCSSWYQIPQWQWN